MKTKVLFTILVAVLLLTACAAGSAASVGSIQITSPWIKAAVNAGNTAAFMVIKNTGSQADRLVKAEFGSAMMVQLMTVDSSAKMVSVDAIDIPANGQVELKSGSFHVMLMKLTSDLADGSTTSLTLTFEKAGKVTFTLPVKTQ